MWIIWGKKIKQQSLGYVADWCSLCRAINPFCVFRKEVVDHVYNFSVGEGQYAGSSAICENCGLAISTNVAKYKEFSLTILPVNALIQRTFPGIQEFYAKRLEIEDQLKRNPRQIPEDLRSELIKEPFALLAPVVAANVGGETNIDKKTGLGCLATIFLPLALLITTAITSRNGYAIAAGVVFLVTLIFTLVSLFMVAFRKPKQYIQQSVLPLLVTCLSVLQPTREELRQCYDRLKTMNLAITRHVELEKLFDALAKSQTSAAVGSSPG
jgi:hypothetical protein